MALSMNGFLAPPRVFMVYKKSVKGYLEFENNEIDIDRQQ